MADWNRRAVLKRGGALAAAGSILPSLAGCGILGHPLLAADSQPNGYPTVEALRFFAKDLASRTDGRLNVQVYPSETLGSQNDSMELAQFGGVDFIRLNMAPLNVLVPETSVPALPFLFRSIQHMRTVMDGRIGREILDALAGYGLIGLAFYDSGARSIYTVDRPIHTPSDMRGLKIRVQTSDLFVAMIEAMGGNATPMAYGEVYQGLVQGVIDGAENNFPSYESTRHFEPAPVYSLTRHVMAPEVFAMSLRSWNKLSSIDQAHVRASAQASVPVMRKLWDDQVATSRNILDKAGVQIFADIDRPAFAARMEPVWDRFADKPRLRQMVEDIRASGPFEENDDD